MKRPFILSLLLFGLSAPLAAQNTDKQAREDRLFNFDWKFQAGEVCDGENPKLDDSTWRLLNLPHDFQFELPWDETANRGRGFKPMGIGWYRKTFDADSAWMGRRVLLDFEGIMLHGDAWLNGTPIGGTDYGYLGFESDITDLLRYDAPNVLAVRADTGKETGSRWYTGGGLFRDVHLIIKDTIAVARHGLFITTPVISKDHAQVNVQVEIEGIKDKEYDLAIRARIFAPTGEQVAETMTAAPKKSKQPSVEIALPVMDIDEPQLWSCESPSLYTTEVELILDGRVTDRVSEKFGIRTIEYSKEFGLKLNGKKVFLKGIAIHHDLGAVGAAAYETSIERMMDRIKEFGFNHIRTSHNPYSEAFLRLADEKGILVVDELYDKWSNTVAWAGRKPWTELWWQNIIEWVKRDRNHASVILWSLGNELQFQEERCGFPTRDWGVTAYRMMDILVKRFDPTRKTTVAMYPARAGGIVKHNPDFRIEKNIVPPELATVTDVASFNYCWDDYAAYLKHAPDMIVYQSEAVTNELAAPYFGMDRDRMVGLAYWGAIEYWGESNAWPKKGWNYSFFNQSLEPYPQAYLIKGLFTEQPMVQIGIVDSEGESLLWNDIVVGQKNISAHWNRENGAKYNLYTYTNAEEVELLVNGKSLGIKKNNEAVSKRNVIYWEQIPYTAGNITAIARTDGKEVARQRIETTGKPVAFEIVPENDAWKADGMSLQYVKVYAIDNRGRRVPTATGTLTFEVDGAAQLIALDNGNHSSNDLFDGNTKSLYKGFAMAILRADRIPGTVRLKVSAQGYRSATTTMKVD